MNTNMALANRDSIPAGDRVHVTETWRGEDRRKQPREEVDIAVRVKVINPLMSTGPASSARVRDRSAGGLKLLTSRPALVGALVQVLMPGKIVLGEVRYCSPAGAEFHLGVRIVESF
jgi:hypothetical protein